MRRAAGDVDVIIITFNAADYIEPCLRSLPAASSRPMHIIVVDNASSDGTAAIVRRKVPNVTLVCNARNCYYAAACNQEIAVGDAGYILLLNPDTECPAGSIDALRDFLDLHPDAAAVAPKLVGPDGKRQNSLREFPGIDTLWYDLTGLSRLFPRSRRFGRWRMGYFDGESICAVDQPMASCLLVRREAFTTVGVFDERYPMFFNDVDWCRRLHEAGRTIYYTPNVTVRHLGGAATRRRKVRMIWMGHYAYGMYLLRLYRRRPITQLIVCLTAPFLVLAAILRSFWWGVIKRLV
ncbi:MAG: glycosyltransferase family 2 protein [candidate division Zixibacteria bacterium]|nr:glycosyltransferase family 2 protein [candidate division Zixibacteria bacterium]